MILATLISCPDVVEDFEAEIERMRCMDADHAGLRAAILRHAGAGADSLRAQIAAEMGADTLEKLMSLPHVALAPPVRHPGDAERATLTLREEFAKLAAGAGMEAELREAVEDIDGLADETLTWRVAQAAEARNRAQRSEQQDRTVYDLGENGLLLDREEREAFARLLGQLDHPKPGR